MSMNLIVAAPCTNFTLASDTRVKDSNGNYTTIFYRVTAWRR